MGLIELIGRDLGLIFDKSFCVHNRVRKCSASSTPYLLGEGHFINYKLCLSALHSENTDLSIEDVIEYDSKHWQIVHIEFMRVLCKIFLQESGGSYA
ncbi:hypothetical protein [Helicobacter felis]|uniref:hypothetical protein n=1 Tax=Helicobacter felis TaxID=214 RepID=UPI000CEE57C5|nr:hypothetical protein [Helicobacter felis]